jgi:hypothetical protein
VSGLASLLKGDGCRRCENGGSVGVRAEMGRSHKAMRWERSLEERMVA